MAWDNCTHVVPYEKGILFFFCIFFSFILANGGEAYFWKDTYTCTHTHKKKLTMIMKQPLSHNISLIVTYPFDHYTVFYLRGSATFGRQVVRRRKVCCLSSPVVSNVDFNQEKMTPQPKILTFRCVRLAWPQELLQCVSRSNHHPSKYPTDKRLTSSPRGSFS